MSASLQGLTNFSTGIAAGATDLRSLFGTSDRGVTIGSVQLSRFEIPEAIHVSDVQALVIHRLFGGARTFDDMGPDPEPITWSGICLGADAATRAQTLLALKNAAQIVQLTWSTFSFNVIISRFEFDAGYSNIPYKISCEIVPPNPAASTLANASSLQGSVLGGLGSAFSGVGRAVTAITNVAQATIGGAQKLLGTAASFASAVGVNIPALNNISSNLVNMQSVASSASGLAEGSSAVGSLLSGSTGTLGLIDSTISSAGSALETAFTGAPDSIVGAAGAGGALANMSQAAGQLGATSINLGQAASLVQSPAAVLSARLAGAGTLAPSATPPAPTFGIL